jgi:hypothetical protein
MEVDAERTLNNLHVLSALSPFDKLITGGDCFDIHPPSHMREIYRTWLGERRTQNVARVRQTVRTAIAHIRKLLDDANALMASGLREDESLRLRVDTIVVQHVRMCEGLQQSCAGLRNLLQTYREDASLASHIHLTITEINDFLCLMHSHTERLRGVASSDLRVTSMQTLDTLMKPPSPHSPPPPSPLPSSPPAETSETP